MTPTEVLAVVALRQWLRDRSSIRNGTVTNYKREGYRPVSYTHLDVYKRQIWSSATST